MKLIKAFNLAVTLSLVLAFGCGEAEMNEKFKARLLKIGVPQEMATRWAADYAKAGDKLREHLDKKLATEPDFFLKTAKPQEEDVED